MGQKNSLCMLETSFKTTGQKIFSFYCIISISICVYIYIFFLTLDFSIAFEIIRSNWFDLLLTSNFVRRVTYFASTCFGPQAPARARPIFQRVNGAVAYDYFLE